MMLWAAQSPRMKLRASSTAFSPSLVPGGKPRVIDGSAGPIKIASMWQTGHGRAPDGDPSGARLGSSNLVR